MPESWATAAGIALDHTADVPLGVQLDWVLRAAVASGRLRAGDRLPGLREVADQLGVNHNTVRAAVAKVEADGLLETRHGSGTFVAAGAATQLRQAALLDEVAQRAEDAGVAPRELAAALYVAEPTAHRALDEATVERRTLRQDLDVLDRILCELEPQLDVVLARDPALARSGGPRLLSAAELRAQREMLLRRVAQVQRALDRQRGIAAPAPDPATAPARVAAAPRRAARARRPPRPGTAPA
jgi:DNA-binding transcriptional regulator YhcF (GntR family)